MYTWFQALEKAKDAGRKDRDHILFEYRDGAVISLCLQNIAQHTGARGPHIWVNG